MIFPFVLLALCLFRYIQVQHTFEPPEDITRYCPHTDFCDVKSTHPYVPPENGDLYTPCCDSCSCDPDCGLSRTCCTPDLDRYKLDDRLGTVCKSLTTKQYMASEEPTYHIVEKCPGNIDTCRMINVSSWGGYWPVYARSSGLLYYNVHCAACNNQTDIVKLLPTMICTSIYTSISKELTSTLNQVGEEEDCFLQFLPTANVIISSQMCYLNVIKDCNCDNETHEVSRLNDLCQGFTALFRTQTGLYNNVYCFLCNSNCHFDLDHDIENWKKRYTACHVSRSGRLTAKSSLIVFLDNRSRKDFEQSLVESDCARQVCFEAKHNSTLKVCRPVHCPEGHVRVKCRCKPLGHTWYVNHPKLCLNLTPSTHHQTLKRSRLAALTEKERVALYEDVLLEVGLQDWTMELFYHTERNSEQIGYLIMVLVMRSGEVRSQEFLDSIHRALQTTWVFTIDGSDFGFRAYFNSYLRYSKLDTEESMPFLYMPDGYSELKIEAWRYNLTEEEVYDLWGGKLIITALTKDMDGPVQYSNRMFITKLFFCEMVDLYRDEFVLSHEMFPGNAHLVKQEKELGSGEFVVSKTREGVVTEVRVCLSDVIGKGQATKIGTSLILVFYNILLQFDI